MAAITDMVDLEIQDGVAVVRIDNPPVNALSEGVRNGLFEAVQKADADDNAKAILIICSGRTYIAGADIKEFGKPHRGVVLFNVQDVIEGASKPVVSTIHGTCLGGGLETAICCHYRVAVASARFGFPEVKLGILPGAGGTQRLPRIVGVEKALEMMVNGNPVGANFALENGLIDEIVDDLFEGGMAFAKKIVEEGRPLVRVRDANEKLEEAKKDPELFNRFRKKVARKTRGFDAPESIIQCVEDTLIKSFDDGIQGERDRFGVLIKGIKSEAQRYYFFAERQANKIPDVPKDTETIPIKKVGMIGAGTMGGGISMNFLSKGTPVTIVESTQEALDRGLGVVRKNYLRGVKSGRLTEADVDKLMGLLTPSLSLEDLADCDMVIEAVFENIDLKKEVFTKLDAIVKEGAILATNSSALDVNAIAAVTKRPEWVVGTHFFSPANIMRLLEVVRAEKTSKTVLATVMALAKRLGKIPVVSGVCPGFIGNRILFKRGVQAQKLIYEGAMPWDVDDVIYDFGFPMGPFAMSDLAGLDIGWDVKTSKGETLRDRLCEMDRRGQKTGAGYYNYDPETRAKTPEPKVEELILEFSEKMGKTRREISNEEILQRCIYPMINEGAKILEEGISQRPSDIDVVWVNGYGWPVYRGGPMFYADTVGLDKVLGKLKEFQEQDNDDFWQPSPLIEKLVAEGKGFKDMA
ncbi:MAG: 3-hydroxyacyl-CoA dehydrogenase NAD-binding domain-containing protein [Verrucomicrobia bacterium]|nr:3-hydroxyacyl-CoA dehydrogenase NAD-binding domain-containing protein [Verrucomicrobiota bacterium]